MTKLFEHILEGGGSITLGLGLDTIKEPLLLLEESEVAPQEYRDITNIVNLDIWGHKAKYSDYLRVRSTILDEFYKIAMLSCLGTVADESEALQLIPVQNTEQLYYFCISDNPSSLFLDKEGYVAIYDTISQEWSFSSKEDLGFSLANNFEKDVAVKYSIMSSKAALQEGYSLARIVEENIIYHKKAQECRKKRLLEASVYIWNIIPENANKVMGFVINPLYGNLYSLYQEFGVKGTLEDYESVRNRNPGLGILDYVLSRDIWIGNGLTEKSWETTNGMTLEDLGNLIYNLLHKGISPKTI